eukprot:SAG31_NODE_10540_length_1126_cov_13.897959_2_plen_74_part_00
MGSLQKVIAMSEVEVDELQKVKEIFTKYDADGSGELDISEVRSFCSELGLDFTDEELMVRSDTQVWAYLCICN